MLSSGAVRTACDIQVDGRRGPGRSKMPFKESQGHVSQSVPAIQ